jgi:hypothetical protein
LETGTGEQLNWFDGMDEDVRRLLEQDFEALGERTFYGPDGKPENEASRQERSKCWKFLQKSFSHDAFKHYLTFVDPGDIHAFYVEVVVRMLSHVAPEQCRVERGAFYSMYIQRGESVMKFMNRMSVSERKLARVRKVSSEDLRDCLLNGVSYHATWLAGSNPKPMLERTPYYDLVQRMESEERAMQTSGRAARKYNFGEIQTRLINEEKVMQSVKRKPKTTLMMQKTTSLFTSGADSEKEKVKPRRMTNRVCWFYLQPTGCKFKDSCTFHHIRGDPPEGIEPARKPYWSKNYPKDKEELKQKVDTQVNVTTVEDGGWDNQFSGASEQLDTGDKQTWPVMDSGSESHLQDKKPHDSIGERAVKVRIGCSKKGAAVLARQAVETVLQGNTESKTKIPIRDMLIAPEMSRALYSVAKISDEGYVMLFDPVKAVTYKIPFEDAHKALMKAGAVSVLIAPRVKDLYLVPPTNRDRDNALEEAEAARMARVHFGTKLDKARPGNFGFSSSFLSPTYTGNMNKSTVMHNRFGHCNDRSLKEAFPHVKPTNKRCFCRACAEVKLKKEPHPKTARREATQPGEMLSYDDHPRPCETKAGKKRQLYFVDHYSGFMIAAPIRLKADVHDRVGLVKRRVQTKFGRPMKILRADSASWNKDRRIAEECDRTGTQQEFSNPGDKAQNGRIEGNIRVAAQISNTISCFANTPPSFWSYSDAYALDIRNHLPRREINQDKAQGRGKQVYKLISRADKWHGQHDPWKLKAFRAYGCECVVRRELENIRMGENRTFRAVFLGFAVGVKSYLVLNIEKKKVVTARTVQCNETSFPFVKALALTRPRLTDYKYDQGLPDLEQEKDDTDSDLEEQVVEEAGQHHQDSDGLQEHQEEDDMREDMDQKEGEEPLGNPNEGHLAEEEAEHKHQSDEDNSEVTPGESDEEEPAIRRSSRFKESSSASLRALQNRLSYMTTGKGAPGKHKQASTLIRLKSGQTFESHAVAMESTSRKEYLRQIMTPSSRRQMLRMPEWPQWIQAEKREMKRMDQHKVFIPLREHPQNTNGTVLPLKWIYSLKFKADGSFDCFRARLVAGGHRRVKGVDHTSAEVYADVARIQTIRGVLAHAVQHPDAHTDHWDCKTAFLHTVCKKVIYTKQPPGYEDPEISIMKLAMAIYGLPEAMRLFCDMLKDLLLGCGFKQGRADPSLYILREGKEWIHIPVVVDDLFPTYNSKKLARRTLEYISQHLEIEDRGTLRSALGIRFKIDYIAGIVEMDQEMYKRQLLEELNMLSGCRTAETPLIPGQKLPTCKTQPTMQELVERGNYPYERVQGCLTWLVTATCPHYAEPVSKTSRHSSNWRKIHKMAQQRICRYMATDLDTKLVYRKQVNKNKQSPVVMMADASFAVEGGMSHTGVLAFLYGNLVMWISTRQRHVATTIQHAETNAAHEGACEAVWQRRLAADLGVTDQGPTKMWLDNKGLIASTNATPRHATNKHFSVKLLYKNELVKDKKLMVVFLESTRMTADTMTKSLPGPALERHKKVMLGYLYQPEKDGIALEDARATKRANHVWTGDEEDSDHDSTNKQVHYIWAVDFEEQASDQYAGYYQWM